MIRLVPQSPFFWPVVLIGSNNRTNGLPPDGGFVGGIGGAAGMHLLAVYWYKRHLKRRMVGDMYIFRINAKSAVEMELLALEPAVKIALHAAYQGRELTKRGGPKPLSPRGLVGLR